MNEVFINEIWVNVVGYEGLYNVSNLGRVKSLDKEISNNRCEYTKKGKILKPYLDKDGYGTVNLYKDGNKKLLKVHRLVAQSFIENNENKPTVNHKNSIRFDNRADNLEWATYSENNQHAFDSGFQIPMKKDKCWVYNINPDLHPLAKKVINLKTGEIYGSLKTASLKNGIKYSRILSKLSINSSEINDTDLIYFDDFKK